MRKHKGPKTGAKHSSHNKHPQAKQRPFKGLDNTRDLDAILRRTKIFQDVLGISREGLSSLYEDALSFLDANRIEEAQASFSLLTKINPFASDFWIGLGICHLQQEEYTQAFNAFTMALTMEPDRYDCYAYAIECCVQMKNYAQAEALLRQAVTYAKRHPSHEESSIILEEAPRILKEIALEKSSN